MVASLPIGYQGNLSNNNPPVKIQYSTTCFPAVPYPALELSMADISDNPRPGIKAPPGRKGR